MDKIKLPQTSLGVDLLTEDQTSEIVAYLINLFGSEEYHKIMDQYKGLSNFLKWHIKNKAQTEREYEKMLLESEKEHSEFVQVGVLVRQQLINLMMEDGKSDEEINTALAACDAHRDNKRDLRTQENQQRRPQDAVQAA